MMGSKLADIIYVDCLADTRYRYHDLLPPANAKIKTRGAHASFDITKARLPTEALQQHRGDTYYRTVETSRTRHLIVALESPSNPNIF